MYSHTLSLHDALPLFGPNSLCYAGNWTGKNKARWRVSGPHELVRSRRLELPRGFPHSDLNAARLPIPPRPHRSEEHTSELQSLMSISYADFCLKKKTKNNITISKHKHKTCQVK